MDSEIVESKDSGSIFDSDLSGISIPGWDEPKTETDTASAENVEVEAAKDAVKTAPEETVVGTVTKTVTTPAAKEPKQLTFKFGETVVPLAETALIDWKVDGKVQPVAVKDLLENYAGKVAYDRKYREVADQRKQAAAEIQNFENVRTRHSKLIEDMHRQAGEGKIFDAVQSMIDMNGLGEKINAREYVSNLRNALMRQAQELAKLTPEQRELYEVKEEQEYTKSRYENALQRQQQEQADRQFQERVTNAMQQSNSTVEEYVQTRDWLADAYRQNNWDVKSLTPEFVASQIRDVRDYRSAKEMLESIDPELSKNEKLWDQAVTMLRDPSWTPDEVKEMFKETTQKKRATTISKKVSGAPVATVAKAGTKSSKAKSSREDYSSFTEADVW